MGYFIDLLESLGIVKSPYVKQERDKEYWEAWELSKKMAEESLKEAQDAMVSKKCTFGVCNECTHWYPGHTFDATDIFECFPRPHWSFRDPFCRLWRN